MWRHDPDGPSQGPGIRTTKAFPGRRRSVSPRTFRRTAISGKTRLRLASTQSASAAALTDEPTIRNVYGRPAGYWHVDSDDAVWSKAASATR